MSSLLDISNEVGGYLAGERNYLKLKGDTGPLVYPAGFLYCYGLLFRLSKQGTHIRLAQYVFAVIYLLTLCTVFLIYRRTQSIPPYALIFLTLSKRLHSIYVLRLFNDGVAMLWLYCCILAMCRQMWNAAALLFAIALSIKMNILLFLPAYGIIILRYLGFLGAVYNFISIALFEILVSMPFLREFPYEYLSRAFELSRVFQYKWTVNWRFISEETFTSKQFAVSLMIGHVTCLTLFAYKKWCKQAGGPFMLVWLGLKNVSEPPFIPGWPMTPNDIVTIMFTCNLIGVIFARTLHYQFYSWYAHQTIFLAWQTKYSILARLAILVAIEYAWNVYPSTVASSLILFMANMTLLIGVYQKP